VVGLARNASPLDWLLVGLQVPIVRLIGILESEACDPDMVVARPSLSLAEVRAASAAALPGRRVRRGLYYRYLLSWTKPPRRQQTRRGPFVMGKGVSPSLRRKDRPRVYPGLVARTT
jgi:hypothetical protein